MPSGALGDRLSRLPGVAECTAGGEGVRLVATPGTDLRLLRARAQAVCADAGEHRPLTVMPSTTDGGGPWVVRPPSAFLTRIGGSKAVALGSFLALGLIATLPGQNNGQLTPVVAPAPLVVTAEHGSPGRAGAVLALALRLPGEDAGPGRTTDGAVVPEPAPGLSVALAPPASVQVSGLGRRTVSSPAPTGEATAGPVAVATPAQPAPEVTTTTTITTTTTTIAKAKNATKSKAKASGSTAATTAQSAGEARPTVVPTHGQGNKDDDDQGPDGGHGKGHGKDD